MEHQTVNQEEQIQVLIKEMTLKEKADMIHGRGFFRTEGVERLSIPPLKFSDGPMGVRQEFQNAKWYPIGSTDDLVTYLPSNSALASTWNKELAYETGKVLGAEARGRGKDMILAPGINIKRSPLCGRNFEYMSEDPKLVEEIAVPLIQGIQENDVSACVKHFAANSQETDRLMVDTIIDERTLQEIYLPGFRAAVQEGGSFSIMGAYNMLNGAHCCENQELLNKILREDWGFDGTVVSDWGGVHKTREAALASLDVEMSVTDDFDDYKLADPLIEAVRSGEIPEEVVDQKVANILRMMLRLKMIGEEKEQRKPGVYNAPEHRTSVYRTAAESVILLKNEEKLLPLDGRKLKKVAVIGRNAELVHSNGGGSAEIKALYEISPLLGLKMRLGGNVEIQYAPGYYVPPKEEEKEENWQQDSVKLEDMLGAVDVDKKEKEEEAKLAEAKEKGKALLAEALELAKECDHVIFVGGLDHNYDVEGQDRISMKLPYDQDEVIEELLKAAPQMTIVLVSGSAVEMPWLDQAKSLVWSYYAGMETGTALADVLLGNVNPSGKLAETFPVCYEDTPTGENGQFGLMHRVEHQEGVLVGYRYYEYKKKKPAFCFGYGLSYTEFAYSDLSLKADQDNEKITVSVCVKNTGSRDGAEAVQLYVGEDKPSLIRPLKELKAFEKVSLQAGQEKKASFEINFRELAFYCTEKKSFQVNPGTYTIYVGASSEDIRLTGQVAIEREGIFNGRK